MQFNYRLYAVCNNVVNIDTELCGYYFESIIMINLTEIFPINDTKIRFGEETFSTKLINGITVSFNTVFVIKFP